jgi:hypothetical protein
VPLQHQPHLRDAGQVTGVDRGDEHAAPRVDGDEILGGKSAQRLPDRRPPKTEVGHQPPLVDARTGR